MGMRKQPEFELQCVVVDLLKKLGKPGLYFTAIPNGEARSAVTGARLKRAGTRAGSPDLLLVWQGKPIGLELKTERGRQSPEQRDTERDWTLAGGVYFVAKGYKAAVGFLTLLDCIKPIHDDDTRFIPRDGAAA